MEQAIPETRSFYLSVDGENCLPIFLPDLPAHYANSAVHE